MMEEAEVDSEEDAEVQEAMVEEEEAVASEEEEEEEEALVVTEEEVEAVVLVETVEVQEEEAVAETERTDDTKDGVCVRSRANGQRSNVPDCNEPSRLPLLSHAHACLYLFSYW